MAEVLSPSMVTTAPPAVILEHRAPGEDMGIDTVMTGKRSEEEPPYAAPAVALATTAPLPVEPALPSQEDAPGTASVSRKRSRGRAGGVLKELRGLLSCSAMPLELPARVRGAPSPKPDTASEAPKRQGSHGGSMDSAIAAAAEGVHGSSEFKKASTPQRAGSLDAGKEAGKEVNGGGKKKEAGVAPGAAAHRKGAEKAREKSADTAAEPEGSVEPKADDKAAGSHGASSLPRGPQAAVPGLELVGPYPPCPNVASVHQACRSNNKAVMRRWQVPHAPCVNMAPPEAFTGAPGCTRMYMING